MESVCFHVVVVKHIETEVYEAAVRRFRVGEKGADGELEFVKYALVDDTVAVDEITEELVVLNGTEMLFGDGQMFASRSVCVDGVHMHDLS